MRKDSILRHAYRLVLVSLASTAMLGAAACGSDDGNGLEVESTGTATMPLSSWASNGSMYRLEGTFTITGTTSRTLFSGGDEASVEVKLPAGSYQVALSGWRLYEVLKNSTLREVTSSAVLTSQNPLPFTIAAGASTPLKFAFDLSGNGLPFGEGEADIDIEVKTPERKVQVTTGAAHTCVLMKDGNVRCWGQNTYGQLGYGHVNSIGDNELPSTVSPLWIGGTAKAIDAGSNHTCAILDNGLVRCWGQNTYGQLGYGHTNTIGDNEQAGSAGTVNLNGKAIAISAGGDHTCALMEWGAVRCWGNNNYGQLGYGNTNIIGDNESPAYAGDIKLGEPATAISAGTGFTCALLESGAVRCWGNNNYGQLGHGHTSIIGDNEHPTVSGDAEIGAKAVAIDAGGSHTCAVLDDGGLRCWGSNAIYQLGLGMQGDVYGLGLGDAELPLVAGNISVGGAVAAVATGTNHTCALLVSGGIVCWGHSVYGKLGYGNPMTEMFKYVPSTYGTLPITPTGLSLTASDHTCLLTSSDAVYCWGTNSNGQLGLGNTQHIGDNEAPSSVGAVQYQ